MRSNDLDYDEAEVKPIAVTVVGGYLGAGKTTLVNHVLRCSDEHIAVIVNDFGEISIDEDLIVAADSDKLTLANGCICCSLADGFAAALMQVRSSESVPTRLLIEASGVSDPAQIAAYGHTPGLRLDAVAVVVDAETVQERASDRWVADTVRRQIGSADLLILNKVDLLRTSADSDDLCDWLREIAPGAAMVRATHAEVPLDVLFDSAVDKAVDKAIDVAVDAVATAASPASPVSPATSSHSHEAAHDAAHDAADVFESCTVLLDKPIPIETMTALLEDLPEYVLRLKGLVQLNGSDQSPGAEGGSAIGDYVVQAVGKRVAITAAEQHSTLAESGGERHSRYALSVVALKNSAALDWLESRLSQAISK